MTRTLRDRCAPKTPRWLQRIIGMAVALTIIAFTSLTGLSHAQATPISYQIFNHPDSPPGSPNLSRVDSQGSILRLDIGNTIHSFNANHSTVTLSWDPLTDPTTATISGLVTHNQSGTNINAFDAQDDVYQLSATFESVSFTDESIAPLPWFGSHTPNQTYNDMLNDLRHDANTPDRSVEKGKSNASDVARIYWDVIDATLTPISIKGQGNTYTGATQWDEFGLPLFMQYRWRLWDPEFAGSEFDQIATAGWVEKAGNHGQQGINDFLFVVNQSPVPEPTSLTLMMLGTLMLLKRRKKQPTI